MTNIRYFHFIVIADGVNFRSLRNWQDIYLYKLLSLIKSVHNNLNTPITTVFKNAEYEQLVLYPCLDLSLLKT